ncbi:NAD-dependent epimerase/dehydratase family protein [Paenibacillus sp. GCM10023248]|uniref:NAD-dependent epimerase/dehydratase family protein n=1 Tax=unclassified Paenibacillus TaxID=185978 RepID=UPI0023786277|nr:NAD-dependent epimerase/dehydratase family protein [Paenibacillus sp. MAHUQ-63]MDD9269975.1 GDP-mannose 4,6-dehydratase [Paenibacillus sp. MAHUQ-63]
MKKVVITGAAGFLGSHLAKELIQRGHQVIGLDNFSTGKAENIRELSESKLFTCFACDVAEEHAGSMPALSGIDEIYHLASPASPKFYQAEPFATIRVNTAGTANMLELARRNNAKMVFTSTSEAYGDPVVHPQPEDYRGNVNTWGPRACYDEAKRLGEVYCYEYASRYGVKVKVARIFNTYSAGLRNDDGRVISNFVTQALNGQDITVYGDGSQTRSFCYVDDTVRGLRLMMDREEANGQLINLGNPVEISVMEVAHLVKSLAQSSSRITFSPLPQDDPKVRRPVIDKAKTLLGWEPFIDLKEGLRLTIEAYQAKLSK